MMYVAYITYDRRGDIWKAFQPGYSLYEKGDLRFMDGQHTAWSWTYVHSYDSQTNRMSRFIPAREVRGGYKTGYNLGDIYNKYFTVQAIRRLGV